MTIERIDLAHLGRIILDPRFTRETAGMADRDRIITAAQCVFLRDSETGAEALFMPDGYGGRWRAVIFDPDAPPEFIGAVEAYLFDRIGARELTFWTPDRSAGERFPEAAFSGETMPTTGRPARFVFTVSRDDWHGRRVVQQSVQ